MPAHAAMANGLGECKFSKLAFQCDHASSPNKDGPGNCTGCDEDQKEARDASTGYSGKHQVSTHDEGDRNDIPKGRRSKDGGFDHQPSLGLVTSQEAGQLENTPQSPWTIKAKRRNGNTTMGGTVYPISHAISTTCLNSSLVVVCSTSPIYNPNTNYKLNVII